jgi:hypothetical protein
MGLAIFFFMIFAILGVSLWDGKVHFRCYETPFPDAVTGFWQVSKTDTRLCSESRDCLNGEFCASRYEVALIGNNKYNLNKNYLNEDSDVIELNYGITNFDDIGSAFLTIF